jgi:hypothetical protein
MENCAWQCQLCVAELCFQQAGTELLADQPSSRGPPASVCSCDVRLQQNVLNCRQEVAGAAESYMTRHTGGTCGSYGREETPDFAPKTWCKETNWGT